MTIRLWSIAAGLAGLAAFGCESEKQPDAAHTEPAKVAQPTEEKDLATITLTPKAEKRLGIVTVEVERKAMRRQRTLGGEVVLLPGRGATVSAPVSGTLAAPPARTVPPPGARVEQGEPIFTLLPLKSSEKSVLTLAERAQMAEARAGLETLRAQADQQVELAVIRVEAARKTRDRAEQLLRDRAGSRQSVDDATAAFDLAQRTLETSRERLAILEATQLDADAGALVPLTVRAPLAGILSNFSAVPGELVVTGATLFEVVNYDRVWIRVPVYVGQWGEIDTRMEAEALVTEFGQKPDLGGWRAKPVAAPPSADPAAATVDLFYELENADGRLRPGHKVAVTLALLGDEENLVIPWSAVLHDIHGGTWVYEEVAPQTFVRRRVRVRFVSGAEAVLADGPDPGATIVTDGAAELFGTEFGFGK